jgi:hypothetical protein
MKKNIIWGVIRTDRDPREVLPPVSLLTRSRRVARAWCKTWNKVHSDRTYEIFGLEETTKVK